jgi:flagellin-like hook-associated protein FlgL
MAVSLAETRARVAERSVDLEVHLSKLRDADFAEVVTNLTRDETALQASLQMMTRLLPPSLMDFLG